MFPRTLGNMDADDHGWQRLKAGLVEEGAKRGVGAHHQGGGANCSADFCQVGFCRRFPCFFMADEYLYSILMMPCADSARP